MINLASLLRELHYQQKVYNVNISTGNLGEILYNCAVMHKSVSLQRAKLCCSREVCANTASPAVQWKGLLMLQSIVFQLEHRRKSQPVTDYDSWSGFTWGAMTTCYPRFQSELKNLFHTNILFPGMSQQKSVFKSLSALNTFLLNFSYQERKVVMIEQNLLFCGIFSQKEYIFIALFFDKLLLQSTCRKRNKGLVL